MTRVVELADRLAIERNVGDFAHALDLRRWDLLDQVFTADARIGFGGRSMSLEEAKGWLRQELTAPGVRGYLHMVGNLRITLMGDMADSIAHVFAPLETVAAGEARLGFNGIWYGWRHVRTPMGWRIAGSLDQWAKPKPDWQPGFYGWVTPPYPAATDWSAPLPPNDHTGGNE
jgi:hypothetical protein